MKVEPPFTEDDLRQMVLRLAHEIRNPLATIQSAAQLLEHLQRPSDDIAEFYQSIYVEITRIDRVVRGMQRFARVSVPDPTSVAIADVVLGTAETVMSGKSQEFPRVQVETGPPAKAFVDGDQLQVAIEELLNNAIRFSPEDAIVRVVWELLNNQQVAIHVEDQGPGIPEEYKDQIFRPFFSSSVHGTGLGLNIVSRTCHFAGGKLEWVNGPEAGAKFSILLPLTNSVKNVALSDS